MNVGNFILAFIVRRFEYKSWNILFQLSRTLLRLHLENCLQVAQPYFGIDGVQPRNTSLIPEMAGWLVEE